MDSIRKSRLEKRFNILKDQWVEETMMMSSLDDIVDNPSHQEILAMGSDVIELILKDLEKERKHWFYALHVLTGVNPIKKEDAGNVKAMAQVWIDWGRTNGYL